MHIHDVSEGIGSGERIFKYRPEGRGTVIVRHVWHYQGKDIDIIQPQIFNNVHQHNATAFTSDKWGRISRHDTYSIVIDQDEQELVYSFEYEPIPDWIITNNFHNLAINTLLLDVENKVFLSPEKPVYINSRNHYAYIDGKTICIAGQPVPRARYVIHGKYTNIENSLASIAVRHRSGNFGHFFAPMTISTINFYEQDSIIVDIARVTQICSFVLTNNEPERIFVL